MLSWHCGQMAGRKQAGTPLLRTGGPFISELRTFQSNSIEHSLRHCFSTFNVHRAFFSSLFFVSNKHSVIITTQTDLQMCHCFREQRVDKNPAWRNHDCIEPLVYQDIFCSLVFFQLVNSLLELFSIEKQEKK